MTYRHHLLFLDCVCSLIFKAAHLRRAQSKGSTRLGASLPEDGSRAAFPDIVLLEKLDDGQGQKNKIELITDWRSSGSAL
jgi:hypothetical protein